MNKTDIVKIANRDTGVVGYKIEELGIRRQFAPRETKEVTFEELERLSFLQGGDILLKNYLIVKDPEVMKELNIDVEPEYYYTEKEVKELLIKGTLDEFLDCLDFAPDGVIDLVKKLAVSLPLNDVSKREALLEKTGFNVTRAIEIENTKFDGDAAAQTESVGTPKRRTAAPAQSETTPTRRALPKYKVVGETE